MQKELSAQRSQKKTSYFNQKKKLVKIFLLKKFTISYYFRIILISNFIIVLLVCINNFVCLFCSVLFCLFDFTRRES